MRTQTQLGEQRLKLAPEQRPLAYLRLRRHGDVPLYDPQAAVKMRPLPTRHHQCPDCRREQLAEERLRARACRDCKAVRERSWPRSHGRCGKCRRAQLAELQHKAAAWIEEVTVCATEGYSVRIVPKKEARAFQKAQHACLKEQDVRLVSWGLAPHWPVRCPPCQATYERHQIERARQRAEEEREREQRRIEERRLGA
ncbi:hypothetical protein [Streptomyces sp. NPDC002851]